MEFSLDSYRMIARQCAYAHRTKDQTSATEFFRTLRMRLDRETLDNHCVARREFNDAFAYAYRNKWTPDDDTAALASAVGVSAVGSAIAPRCDAPAPRVIRNRCDPKGNPRELPYPLAQGRASVALDCAAFYASKSPA